MLAIFDSGLGGLTAVKEIRRLMPAEELVYFGDTGRVPYGTRSRDVIIRYATEDVNFLMRFQPRAILAACGTVSTTALSELRRRFDLPIIGVVEGAARRAAEVTKNGTVGVIGTPATIRSGAFENELKRVSPLLSVVSAPCPLFVPLVENGFVEPDNEVTYLVAKRYLEPIAQSGADTLILGCTHYPLIAPVIARVLPGVTLINAGAEAARLVADWFGTPEGSETSGKQGAVRYYVSDDVSLFNETASLFLGEDVKGQVEKVIPGDI